MALCDLSVDIFIGLVLVQGDSRKRICILLSEVLGGGWRRSAGGYRNVRASLSLRNLACSLHLQQLWRKACSLNKLVCFSE